MKHLYTHLLHTHTLRAPRHRCILKTCSFPSTALIALTFSIISPLLSNFGFLIYFHSIHGAAAHTHTLDSQRDTQTQSFKHFHIKHKAFYIAIASQRTSERTNVRNDIPSHSPRFCTYCCVVNHSHLLSADHPQIANIEILLIWLFNITEKRFNKRSLVRGCCSFSTPIRWLIKQYPTSRKRITFVSFLR